jgi:hypothetical protein
MQSRTACTKVQVLKQYCLMFDLHYSSIAARVVFICTKPLQALYGSVTFPIQCTPVCLAAQGAARRCKVMHVRKRARATNRQQGISFLHPARKSHCPH